jgi:O-antigen/teichoic acid export membrane protein
MHVAPNRWLGNSAWSVAGNGFYAFCQWLLLVVMARLGTSGMVGQFAMGLAVSAPVFLFANLQIRAIQSTDVSDDHSFGEYLGLRLLTTAAAVLVLCGIVAIATYDTSLKRAILAIGLSKAIESISDVYHGNLQRQERMNAVACYLAMKGLGAVIVAAVLVKLSGSAFAAGAGMALVFAIVLWFGERRSAAGSRVRWNWPVFGRLIRMALPLGLVMMLISLTANMPRYFIEGRLGPGAVGVFAALSCLSIAGSTVVNGVGLAVTPRLSRFFVSGERGRFAGSVAQMSGLALLAGIAGVGILVLGGTPLLTLIYGPVYAARLDVAIGVMAAGAVSYVASVIGYGLTAARCFHQQLPLFALVTVATGVALWILVPRYGLMGAVAAQLLGASVQLICGAAILLSGLRRPALAMAVPAEAAA